MSDYIKIPCSNMMINKKDEIFHSGYHYCIPNLSIMKGGSIKIEADSEWWDKDKKKWTILEIRHDLYLAGEINVLDWSVPIVKEVKESNEINVDDEIISGFDDITTLGSIQLKHNYYFYQGGRGGDGTSGKYANNFSFCPGGKGGEGSLTCGGGGGGGVAFVLVEGERGNRPGGDAKGITAGIGGAGFIAPFGYHAQAGNGGHGGFTGNNGVGGLLVIICHGNLIIDGGKISLFGKDGQNGVQGDNSTRLPTNIHPNYPLLNGAGGGGAGSSGLPGGKLYILHKSQIDDQKIIDCVDIHGGNLGYGQPAGNAILLRNGEFLFSHEAGSGGDGKKGDDGKIEIHKI